ncbi:hypothetical protein O6H91_08G105700 [Diphasiastrum complanatum]|nr:hypothetical protein O6H91_08G105700 [Diphasiastrum complanatum]
MIAMASSFRLQCSCTCKTAYQVSQGFKHHAEANSCSSVCSVKRFSGQGGLVFGRKSGLHSEESLSYRKSEILVRARKYVLAQSASSEVITETQVPDKAPARIPAL